VVKELKKLPEHVVIKLRAWVNDVEDRGLPEVKKYLAIMTNQSKEKKDVGNVPLDYLKHIEHFIL
jgi:mRNA-degrading endonuclease RelE of RelBE toxin-antitoxin system